MSYDSFSVYVFVCDRIQCVVENVVPHGAASVVRCNGLSDVATADVVIDDDDDDDDVICVDDDLPPVKQKQSAGCVALCILESHSSVVRVSACLSACTCVCHMPS